LAKELDFEDLRQPHVYSLIVTATEDSGGFSTSVDVSEWKILVEWLWYRKDGEKAFSYNQRFKAEIDEI